MSNPRISKHYERYAKYWKLYSKEFVKNKVCEVCGSGGILTVAHLDQNPLNNEKKTLKYYAVHAIYNLTNPIMCLVK